MTSVCYLDTSYVVSIVLGEDNRDARLALLNQFQRLVAANLLEAELRSVLTREGVVDVPEDLLAAISWVMPGRPLSVEIERVLAAGYLRGGDAWHVACALFVSPVPAELSFVTMDLLQRQVAAALGFQTPVPRDLR